MIYGIHHISLKCANNREYMEEMFFYTQILGLDVAKEWDSGMMINLGNGYLEIFNNGKEQLPQGTIRHFALAVDDVDYYADEVRRAGYQILSGPLDIGIPTDPPYPARIAFVKGPIGEEIELFCEK